MKPEKIYAIYFSPTDGTEKTVTLVAEKIQTQFNLPITMIDFTRPDNRTKKYEFAETDLVIIGMPVYAGRVPNKIAPNVFNCFEGNNTPVIPLVCYGNRSPGDALFELQQIMEKKNFLPVGKAAIVTRHAFTDVLAGDRPDEDDKKQISEWCHVLCNKLSSDEITPIESVLNRELLPYYKPLMEDGTPANFLKAKPLTDPDFCIHCRICARVCPMGSISEDDVSEVEGICMKCQACVRNCPKNAKFFANEQFLSHVKMLEENYSGRSENLFII